MANRHWVGGTATRNGTAGTKWATTSGGAGGASVPSSSDDVFFDGASGTVTVTFANSGQKVKSLNFTGFTGTFAGSTGIEIWGDLTLGSGMTVTYTGPIVFTENNANITCNGISLASDITKEDTTTLTLLDTLNVGTSTLTLTEGTLNTNGQTVTCGIFNFGGSAVRTLTLGSSIINCTNITASLITNLTLNSNTSQINVTGSGTTSIPGLTLNNVTFSGSNNRTPIGAISINNLTFTSGYTGTVSGSGSTLTIRGNYELGPNMILTYTGLVSFTSTTTGRTITSNGKVMTHSISFNGVGGGWTLQDNLISTGSFGFVLNHGTFDANNFDVSCLAFFSSTSNIRSLLMGSGTRTITGVSSGLFRSLTTTTNMTLNPGTSTIRVTANTPTNEFRGGGLVYNNIWCSPANSGQTIRFLGNNTFNDFKVDAGRNVAFTAGTTTTVTTFDAVGTSTAPITIGSITSATHNLVKAGGGTITGEFLHISNSAASPGTTWYANKSLNNGNNSGWIFGATGNFLSFM